MDQPKINAKQELQLWLNKAEVALKQWATAPPDKATHERFLKNHHKQTLTFDKLDGPGRVALLAQWDTVHDRIKKVQVLPSGADQKDGSIGHSSKTTPATNDVPSTSISAPTPMLAFSKKTATTTTKGGPFKSAPIIATDDDASDNNSGVDSSVPNKLHLDHSKGVPRPKPTPTVLDRKRKQKDDDHDVLEKDIPPTKKKSLPAPAKLPAVSASSLSVNRTGNGDETHKSLSHWDPIDHAVENMLRVSSDLNHGQPEVQCLLAVLKRQEEYGRILDMAQTASSLLASELKDLATAMRKKK